jgi:ComF family protein
MCAGCFKSVSLIRSPMCTVCGVPFMTIGGEDHVCGECLDSRRRYDRAVAAAVYDGPVLDLVHSLKYRSRTHLAGNIAELMRDAAKAMDKDWDLVVPVPLHRRRLFFRSYNQSLLVARCISVMLGTPVDYLGLRRIRNTPAQVGMKKEERSKNVRDAFKVAPPGTFKGKKVLLVDDVYTTGATVNECARVLKKDGAKKVDVLTAARVPLR